MATIRLDHLKKAYNPDNLAVKDFNLTIQEGEFIVLVGPSGCGKTTTLRMIAGLEKVTSGQIYIDDIDVTNKLPKDRDLAMVFQNYALYPHLSVYDNIAYPLKLRKQSKESIKEAVTQAAKMLGLEEQLTKKPAQLSGGQKQRVALGRCMVRTPKAFLMDEPLSNLDAKLRVQMRSEIVSLQKQLHKTFIYVTHDQTEAMTMGDRIVIMKYGQILQIGRANDIYHQPANRFVAEFIGTPPMNVLAFKQEIPHFNGRRLSQAQTSIDLGIRPEKISTIPQKNALSFTAKVDHIEPLGAENHVIIRVNGKRLVVRDFHLTPLRPQDDHTFFVSPNDFYFFDHQNGQAVPNFSL